MAKTIKITQTRSAIGRLPKHKATLLGLGLRWLPMPSAFGKATTSTSSVQKDVGSGSTLCQ